MRRAAVFLAMVPALLLWCGAPAAAQSTPWMAVCYSFDPPVVSRPFAVHAASVPSELVHRHFADRAGVSVTEVECQWAHDSQFDDPSRYGAQEQMTEMFQRNRDTLYADEVNLTDLYP